MVNFSVQADFLQMQFHWLYRSSTCGNCPVWSMLWDQQAKLQLHPCLYISVHECNGLMTNIHKEKPIDCDKYSTRYKMWFIFSPSLGGQDRDVKDKLTKSKDLSLQIRENDWYSFSGRGYRWNIAWTKSHFDKKLEPGDQWPLQYICNLPRERRTQNITTM